MGAEIHDFDSKQMHSDKDLNFIQDLFYQHQFLVFRNQNLTPEEQIKFCQRFGKIVLHPLKEVPWKYREITYVANINLEGELFETCGPTFELWHSDTCYLSQPAKMSFLYAEKVPAKHGETLFANMYQAYRDLPVDLQNKIEGKKAIFGSSYKLMKRCQDRGYPLHINEEDMCPDVEHPVVRTHPVTKQKSIYVNWAHTDSIVGMNPSESDEILDYLYRHCRQEKYIYTHNYQQGDLVVWDNASTIHSNCEGKLTEPRIMRRVMIEGPVPA